MAEPLDEFTLLCERCGYVIEGIDEAGVCPECANPVRESMPALARPGTPWQNDPSVRTLFATLWAMIRRPGVTLSRARIDRRSGAMLTDRCALLAACIWVMPAFVCGLVYEIHNRMMRPNIARSSRDWFELGCIAALAAIIALLLAWELFAALTLIERLGIRAYGKAHHRRITRAVASTICGHASIGWITATLLSLLPVLLALMPGWNTLLLFAPLGFFVGLLHFEILVYLGVRRCRYANRELAPKGA